MPSKEVITHAELSEKLFEVISASVSGDQQKAQSTLKEPNQEVDTVNLTSVSSKIALTNLLAELTLQISPMNSHPVFAKFCALVEVSEL